MRRPAVAAQTQLHVNYSESHHFRRARNHTKKMAEVQNVSVVPIPSPLQLGHRHIDHILQLEDDCLAAIMRTFSLDELCAAAETCRRLESVARQAFVLREECRSYEISDVNLDRGSLPHFEPFWKTNQPCPIFLR